jgi:hypothetical protein
VFLQEENLQFLIFALDKISFFRTIKKEMFWEKDKTTLSKIIEIIISGDAVDITSQIISYSTFRYFYITKTIVIDDNYFDFIRVVRNLTHNTNDKSRREWARLFNSIEQLITIISKENIYSILSQHKEQDLMEGFYVPQREEEVLKARIIIYYPNSKIVIFKTEDNNILKGNIICLLRATYAQFNSKVKNINIDNINIELFDNSYFDKNWFALELSNHFETMNTLISFLRI